MTERRYTVHELDDLREVVEFKVRHGTYVPDPTSTYYDWGLSEKNIKEIEERVRTHMIAGHTADDLRNASGNIPDQMPAYEAQKRLIGSATSR